MGTVEMILAPLAWNRRLVGVQYELIGDPLAVES